MSYLTSIADETEGRQVDFLMEVGLAAVEAFWKNATIQDVTGAIEASEESWPTEKLLELAATLVTMAKTGGQHVTQL